LTSQIFANIYLNELDRFIKHNLKANAYLRYGDDFAIFSHDLEELREFREKTVEFITDHLKLILNSRADSIHKTKQGLYFLGVRIYPKGRRLSNRNRQRIFRRLSNRNASSYRELLTQHDRKKLRELEWMIGDLIL